MSIRAGSSARGSPRVRAASSDTHDTAVANVAAIEVRVRSFVSHVPGPLTRPGRGRRRRIARRRRPRRPTSPSPAAHRRTSDMDRPETRGGVQEQGQDPAGLGVPPCTVAGSVDPGGIRSSARRHAVVKSSHPVQDPPPDGRVHTTEPGGVEEPHRAPSRTGRVEHLRQVQPGGRGHQGTGRVEPVAGQRQRLAGPGPTDPQGGVLARRPHRPARQQAPGPPGDLHTHDWRGSRRWRPHQDSPARDGRRTAAVRRSAAGPAVSAMSSRVAVPPDRSDSAARRATSSRVVRGAATWRTHHHPVTATTTARPTPTTHAAWSSPSRPRQAPRAATPAPTAPGFHGHRWAIRTAANAARRVLFSRTVVLLTTA